MLRKQMISGNDDKNNGLNHRLNSNNKTSTMMALLLLWNDHTKTNFGFQIISFSDNMTRTTSSQLLLVFLYFTIQANNRPLRTSTNNRTEVVGSIRFPGILFRFFLFLVRPSLLNGWRAKLLDNDSL